MKIITHYTHSLCEAWR